MKTPVAELASEDLVDRWGALRARAAAIGDEVEGLKGEFERRGLKVVAGLKWAVLKKISSFRALDVKAIQAEMGAEWCEQRKVPRSRTEYAFSAVEAAPAEKGGKARPA